MGLMNFWQNFSSCSSFYRKIFWKLKALFMGNLWRQKRLPALLYLLEATCAVAGEKSRMVQLSSAERTVVAVQLRCFYLDGC